MDRTLSASSLGNNSPRSSVASSHADFGILEGSVWEEDTQSCMECGAGLGKLRRHHCRLCGRCVCAACSPNSVQIQGLRKLQRACTPCVASAASVPLVKRRLSQLGESLRALGGLPGSESGQEVASLLEATSICEGALLPVEAAILAAKEQAQTAQKECRGEKTRNKELAADVSFAQTFLCAVGEQLHATSGPGAYEQPGADCSLREAADFCQRGLDALGSRQARTPARSRASSLTPSCSPIMQEDTPESRKSRLSSGSRMSVAWEEDMADCSICGSRLGKRYLRPRHHCRLCGKCVCSQCSPSFLQLAGVQAPQRVCSPCVADAQQASSLKKRTMDLGLRLQQLLQSPEPTEPQQCDSLAHALSYCEAALAQLEASDEVANKSSERVASEDSGARRLFDE